MRAVRRPPRDVEYLPRLADLARLERASDGPIPDLALRIWRHGSARAAARFHRESLIRLAREEVREAVRICRAREARGEGPELCAEARGDLARCWRAYRDEIRGSEE